MKGAKSVIGAAAGLIAGAGFALCNADGPTVSSQAGALGMHQLNPGWIQAIGALLTMTGASLLLILRGRPAKVGLGLGATAFILLTGLIAASGKDLESWPPTPASAVRGSLSALLLVVLMFLIAWTHVAIKNRHARQSAEAHGGS